MASTMSPKDLENERQKTNIEKLKHENQKLFILAQLVAKGKLKAEHLKQIARKLIMELY